MILDTKIQHTHNVRMLQARNSACLGTELLDIAARQFGMQHFDGGLGLQVNVYAEIDISKAATPKVAHQAIVSKLLGHVVGHVRTPFEELFFLSLLFYAARWVFWGESFFAQKR